MSASPGSAFPITYGGRLEHGGGGGSSNTYPYAASDGERSDSYLSMHACMHACMHSAAFAPQEMVRSGLSSDSCSDMCLDAKAWATLSQAACDCIFQDLRL